MDSWLRHSYFQPGDTVAQVTARLGQLVDDLALDHFSFGLVRPPRDGGVDCESTILASYPQEWINRYVRHHYLQLDPVADLTARSAKPFYWGHGRFLRAFRKQQRLVFEEARAFRIVCGLAIPVRCARGAVGVFNVVATDAKRLGEATHSEHERLFAAAYDTHDFVLKEGLAAKTVEGSGPCLSVREKECLVWTSEGKTAEEVAAILGLSVYTVNRHASVAARKLGCLNKHHATFRALRAGLI
ncbi:MAG: LuxR family transcriptional regulator [Rhodospirillaceae bacterium]|nr:LuxR family transcriptional regulator [Rhodospirillaceae bacterium]